MLKKQIIEAASYRVEKDGIACISDDSCNAGSSFVVTRRRTQVSTGGRVRKSFSLNDLRNTPAAQLRGCSVGYPAYTRICE